MKKYLYLPYVLSILGIPVGLFAGWGLVLLISTIVAKLGDLFRLSGTSLAEDLLWLGSISLVCLLAVAGIVYAWTHQKRLVIPLLVSVIIGVIVPTVAIVMYALSMAGFY